MSESFEHFFISCHYSKNFWAEVIKWLDNQGVKIGQFSDKDLLFGILKCEDELPYLLVYKSTSCISRPPILKVKNRISHHFWENNRIHTNRNFPKHQSFLPESVLKTRWIKKSRGLIVRSEVYQDQNLHTCELFDLLQKYFTIFGSKLHSIWLPLISTLTKGMPKSFERSLEENTAILENLVTKLRIWRVLETKHLPGH